MTGIHCTVTALHYTKPDRQPGKAGMGIKAALCLLI
jgi:hypothetical protein